MAISDDYFYASHGLKVTKGCEGCQLIKEAYDKGYNEVMRKASLLLRTMREVTPEEQEAINKAIRDMSYGTGVTLQGLYNHETYISMSELKKIKNEIDNLDFDFGDFYDHTRTIHNMIDEVWDKHIKEHDKWED